MQLSQVSADVGASEVAVRISDGERDVHRSFLLLLAFRQTDGDVQDLHWKVTSSEITHEIISLTWTRYIVTTVYSDGYKT